MSLRLVEHALETCATHLDATDARASEIEAFLTRYLLVLVVAVFEEECERLIAERAAQAKDEPLAAFVNSATHQLLRSTKLSELKGYLGRFSVSYRDAFEAAIGNDRARLALDAIVQSRHEVAHRGGQSIPMTLDDLRQHVTDSREVLEAFAAALGNPVDASATPVADDKKAQAPVQPANKGSRAKKAAIEKGEPKKGPR